jgi:hypothetical protein
MPKCKGQINLGSTDEEGCMTSIRNGLARAAKDTLLGGKPLTRLEAMVLFGVANLPDVVKAMRREGWIVEQRLVPYAAAMKRINEHAMLKPPPNLPIREVLVTEYRVAR